jgi:hypothetical protein
VGRHDRALRRCTGNGAQRRRYSGIYEIDHIKPAKALIRQTKKAEQPANQGCGYANRAHVLL